MEPEYGEIRVRDVPDRWDARAEALRLVDDDERHPALAQERERLASAAVVEPVLVPELDRQLVLVETVGALFEVAVSFGRRHHPGRDLEDHGAELAAFLQRLERSLEMGPQLVAQPGRHVLVVDVALLLGQRAERLAPVLR